MAASLLSMLKRLAATDFDHRLVIMVSGNCWSVANKLLTSHWPVADRSLTGELSVIDWLLIHDWSTSRWQVAACIDRLQKNCSPSFKTAVIISWHHFTTSVQSIGIMVCRGSKIKKTCYEKVLIIKQLSTSLRSVATSGQRVRDWSLTGCQAL